MRRLLLLVLPLVLVVAACGGDDDDTHAGMGMSETTMMDGGHMAGNGANGAVAENARTIEVTARSFAFDPDRIEVDAGEDIAIKLTATDAEHDFVLDELDTHVVAAAKGDTETGGFTAPDEAGTYHYYCAVTGHRDAGMEGTLVVS